MTALEQLIGAQPQAPSESEAAAPSPSLEEPGEAGLPDWLSPESEAESEPAPQEAAATSPAEATDQPLPEWMQTGSAASEAEAPAIASPEESEEIPAWLKDLQETPAEEDRSTLAAPGEDLPDWLQEIQNEPVREAILPEALSPALAPEET